MQTPDACSHAFILPNILLFCTFSMHVMPPHIHHACGDCHRSMCTNEYTIQNIQPCAPCSCIPCMNCILKRSRLHATCHHLTHIFWHTSCKPNRATSACPCRYVTAAFCMLKQVNTAASMDMCIICLICMLNT